MKGGGRYLNLSEAKLGSSRTKVRIIYFVVTVT